MENTSAVKIDLLTKSAQLIIDKALNARGVEGDWSPTILLGHLSDVDEQVWSMRIGLMVSAHRAGGAAPKLESWEPDELETIRKYEDFTLQAAADQFLRSRRKMVEQLSALLESEWQAQAAHATFGAITVYDLARIALSHDVEHSKALKD